MSAARSAGARLIIPGRQDRLADQVAEADVERERQPAQHRQPVQRKHAVLDLAEPVLGAPGQPGQDRLGQASPPPVERHAPGPGVLDQPARRQRGASAASPTRAMAMSSRLAAVRARASGLLRLCCHPLAHIAQQVRQVAGENGVLTVRAGPLDAVAASASARLTASTNSSWENRPYAACQCGSAPYAGPR
jgi:hypothetical protein